MAWLMYCREPEDVAGKICLMHRYRTSLCGRTKPALRLLHNSHEKNVPEDDPEDDDDDDGVDDDDDDDLSLIHI
eukprot:12167490-Karenia_brevis.AAC.1